MSDDASSPARPLIGWRLLALLYDALPVLALWFVAAALFVLLFSLSGHASRENIAPFSAWQWTLWLCCAAITGLYAVRSWQRGGQTLGMRPWRLQVLGADGQPAPATALWLRFGMGTLSLMALGAGFWWAWLDRDRLTWHDRLSGTRMRRLPRR